MKKNHILKALILFFSIIFINSAYSAKRVSGETKKRLNEQLPILNLSIGDPVLIRTFKKESRLELWMKPRNDEKYVLFKTYPICFYSGGLGPKQRVGDKVTPEGFYGIKKRSMNPNSRFHLSMNINYPNKFDRYYGRTGSLLMIHGACDAVGCYAMGNRQIEEIYYLVEQALKNGNKKIQIHAFPFHLTDEQLSQYTDNKWYDFWVNLKQGYDLFNDTNTTLTVGVKNGNYVLAPSYD